DLRGRTGARSRGAGRRRTGTGVRGLGGGRSRGRSLGSRSLDDLGGRSRRRGRRGGGRAGLRRGRGRRGGRRSGDLGGRGLGGLLGSLGGLVRLLGGGLPASLLGTLLAQAVAVLLGEAAHDRRLDGRGRGLHVLAHLLEGGQDDLALNT